ncbi:MAG: MFS transporter, partial [Deltaproteobacteria bacterium]
MSENAVGGDSAGVSIRTVFSMPVIVASLGYFVDIYDLVLFSIVRVPSLKGIGISGAILANFVAKGFDWRTAFYIGGVLGLMLLILRISVSESGMFKEMEGRSLPQGNFLSLFSSRKRFGPFINSILIGIPTWFVVGILITFSPEFAKTLEIRGAVSAGNSVMFCYLGLVVGDLTSGILSQLLKSRRKVVLIFLVLTLAGITAYFMSAGSSAAVFSGICTFLGFASGYWAIFVTIAAEQFGTNLRAT